MNMSYLQQIFINALMAYPDVLSVLAETLRQNAASLGLLAPGFPEQLGIDNGVGVTANGQPLFYTVVPRRNRSISIRGMCVALQEALDETCYSFGLGWLYVLRVQVLPGGYIGLTLTIGG